MLENDLLELIAEWRKYAESIKPCLGYPSVNALRDGEKSAIEECANQLETVLNKAKDRREALKRHTQLLEAEGFYD